MASYGDVGLWGDLCRGCILRGPFELACTLVDVRAPIDELTNDISVSSEAAPPPTSRLIPMRELGVSNEPKNIPECEETMLFYGDGMYGRSL